MIVRRIALNGWRNYDFETAEFGHGTNVICGANAQGKTNLLEAVYMLSSGRSFRSRFDKELIGFDCAGCEVLADVYSHGREQTVQIRLLGGRPKRILVNGVKKSAAELSEAQKERLVARLSERTGRRILMEYAVNPSLIGGMRLFYDNRQIDDTVRRRLAEIAERISGAQI